MQLVIPAQAAKLVTPLQKLSLSTRLSQITPGSGVIFTLRDWPYLPGSDVEDWASKLVVLALKLFQLLSVKEHTSKLTIESSKFASASSYCSVTKCTCQAVQMVIGHACSEIKCRAAAAIASRSSKLCCVNSISLMSHAMQAFE